MKRFSLYARLLYSVIFLVTIAFVLLSPEEDALHFNNGLMAGKEKSEGPEVIAGEAKKMIEKLTEFFNPDTYQETDKTIEKQES